MVPLPEATQHHKIYAALLAFSRLKMFSRADRRRFAAEFEVLCLEASLGFTGTWKVIHFGTGGRNRAEFGNKLKDALMKLSDVLRESPIDQEINAIPDNNLGDAWNRHHPLQRNGPILPVQSPLTSRNALLNRKTGRQKNMRQAHLIWKSISASSTSPGQSCSYHFAFGVWTGNG